MIKLVFTTGNVAYNKNTNSFEF